jgi:hypothetical protein
VEEEKMTPSDPVLNRRLYRIFRTAIPLNESGAIIGVVKGSLNDNTAQNINFAVSIQYVMKLVDLYYTKHGLKVDWSTGDTTPLK